MTGYRNEGKVRVALEKVWLNSRSEALSRLASLENFTEQLRSGRADEGCLATARSAAHRLAGSLGMFGLDEASSCASEIEALLCRQSLPDITVVGELVWRLRNLMERTPSQMGKPEKCDHEADDRQARRGQSVDRRR